MSLKEEKHETPTPVALAVNVDGDFHPLRLDVDGRILVKCPSCSKLGTLEWKADEIANEP